MDVREGVLDQEVVHNPFYRCHVCDVQKQTFRVIYCAVVWRATFSCLTKFQKPKVEI